MGSTFDTIAIDLGASSGRCIAAHFDGHRLSLDELHRFDNGPVRLGHSLHWDTPRLYSEILRGLSVAVKRSLRPTSLAIDTWGVDYGLLSKTGLLMGLPFHYRDERTKGVMGRVFAAVPNHEIYARTGVQFMALNTLYQLAADAAAGDGRLDAAHRLLFTPDLLGYWLTGESRTEYTIASTSQMLDTVGFTWAGDILDRLGIPSRIMPPVGPPERHLGSTLAHISEETGIDKLKVIAAAGHDTACAVAAVPARGGGKWAYISSGTWSLVGMEIASPIRTPAAMTAGFTNELGIAGTVRFHRNVAGLWILQECQRAWLAAGRESRIDTLLASASDAQPFTAVIDPNNDRFSGLCDMPRTLREYLHETGQRVPQDEASLVRTVLESLAIAYHECITLASVLTNYSPDRIHIVGGGSLNRLLCQFTADVTGLEVLAGPVEATAAGNSLIQTMAAGHLKSPQELRLVVSESFELDRYTPDISSADRWKTSADLLRRLHE